MADTCDETEVDAPIEKHEGSSDLDDDEPVAQESQNQSSKPGMMIKVTVCLFGLVVGIILCFVRLGGDHKINQTLAIAVWMATLWLTELIPLVVTAFLPIVLFPVFGILSSATITSQYANDTIFLLISGFLMALALQRWNLHRRFALKILAWCGVHPQMLLLGIMCGTFLLSMFVSNTATSLMMVPNALSICQALEDSSKHNYRTLQQQQRQDNSHNNFATALFLGIAYAANVGGMASLLGTPANLVFQQQLALFFPEAPEITFALWIGFGLPIAAMLFLCIWVYLSLMYLRKVDFASHVDPAVFTELYASLGPWSKEQIQLSVLFGLEALLWIFRKEFVLTCVTLPGWSSVFDAPGFLADATVGIFVVVLLMVLPGDPKYLARDAPGYDEHLQNDKGTKTLLLDWKTANELPYDIVFLLGGGFALARGFMDSGLSAFLGESLKGLGALSTAGIVFIVLNLIIWLTELTSNTATSNIMIPVAAALAVALETNPYTFMIPVTLACSCAFALPIATPPNMVVFSTGRVSLVEMNKAGLFLNIVSSLVLLLGAYTFIPWALGEAPQGNPVWATATAQAPET